MKKLFTKILAVFTAVLMFCLALPFFTACGSGSVRPDRPKNTGNPKTTPKPTPEPTPDPTPVTFRDSTFEAAFRNKYGYSAADGIISRIQQSDRFNGYFPAV